MAESIKVGDVVERIGVEGRTYLVTRVAARTAMCQNTRSKAATEFHLTSLKLVERGEEDAS